MSDITENPKYITGKTLTFQDQANSATGSPISKNVVPMNFRNSINLKGDFIISTQSSKSTDTIIRARFNLGEENLPKINSANGDWSRIIISLATMDDLGYG